MCTFVWLTRLTTPFPIHGDGIRDQLLVRDCTELGNCHLFGAPSSIGGELRIYQGAVWLDVLTAVRMLGGDTATQVAVVLALDAVAVALTFIVVWHWLQPALALPAGYLLASALARDQSASVLVNGSASALFDVMTAAALLCYGISNRTRFLLVSAFAAALAVNVHVAAGTLVPGLLLVSALGPRPYRAVLTAGALFAGVYFVTSGAALEANCIALADRGWVFVLVPAVVLLVAVASTFGPPFRKLSVNVRAVLIGCVVVLPFVFGSLWLVLIEKHGFESRYLHPILGAVAVFEAAILCAPFLLFTRRLAWLRWVPSVLVLWSMTSQMSGGTLPPDPSRFWTLTDATKIGIEAANAGWSFEDLTYRLQSNACAELLLGIAVEGPLLNGRPPGDDLQLQVATVDSEPVPPSATDEYAVVPLRRGRFGVLRTVRSWMQPRGIVVCRQSVDGTAPPSCERPRGDVAGRRPPDGLVEAPRHPREFSFESRATVSMWPVAVPEPYITSYRIPVHPVAGEAREFRLTDPGGGACRWEFAHAEGLRIQNALPATHVRLSADNAGPGVLVIEKLFGGPPCATGEMEYPYPPCILETRPGEAFARLVTGTQ